jgi:hypothetical protein
MGLVKVGEIGGIDDGATIKVAAGVLDIGERDAGFAVDQRAAATP